MADLVQAMGDFTINNGARVSNLYNGSRSLFEAAGFTYIRPKGAGNCVMRKEIA
jgi:hypothetical protein